MPNNKYICIKVKSEINPPIPAIVKLEEHFKTFKKYNLTSYGLNHKITESMMDSLVGGKVLFYIRKFGNSNFMMVADLVGFESKNHKLIKTQKPVPLSYRKNKHRLWLQINQLDWIDGKSAHNFRKFISLNNEKIPEIRSGFARIKKIV